MLALTADDLRALCSQVTDAPPKQALHESLQVDCWFVDEILDELATDDSQNPEFICIALDEEVLVPACKVRRL